MGTWNKIIIKGFIYIFIVFLLLGFSDDIAIYLWGHDNNEEATAFGTLLASIIAIGAILGLIIQLFRTEMYNKRQRTYDLISKYYQPDYLHETVKALHFLQRDLVKAEKIDRLFNYKNEHYVETLKFCTLLFSYYEDICQMYNTNLLDKSVLKRALRGKIIRIFEDSEFLIIEYRRRFKNDRIYIEWQNCVNDLRIEPSTENYFTQRINKVDAQN